MTSKDRPWIANYPPLKEWLDKHARTCMWQLSLGGPRSEPVGYIEGWLMNTGRIAVIVVHSGQRGWELYTPLDTNEIAATLTDAEHRLGITAREPSGDDGFDAAMAGVAQGVINIAEGHTTIEAGSRVHASMSRLCELVTSGRVGLKP